MKRNLLVGQLERTEDWDVVIIGGGATGLGIAMDAATRGYKTLLLEQADFTKGTSSKATKLVHGGVRYMAQGDLALVREACYERGLLLKNAPHLTRNTTFVIPNYTCFDNFLYTVGLKFYDFLAGKLSLGKSKYVKKANVLADLTTIKESGLKGGVEYQDGQFDDSRLALNIAQTAIENGACVLNYFKVVGVTKSNTGKLSGVKAQDVETGKEYTISGKVVVNATGVYVDNILQMDTPNVPHFVRPSQGVHLVVDKSFLPGDKALMIPKTSDGRVLFAVPWHDKVVVGTTDTLREKPELEPKALEQEVDFILATAALYMTKPPTKNDVLAVFAGLRPLAAPQGDGKNTKEISRSHKIMVSDSGLITIIGGKWTTFRRMAQDTVNEAIKKGMLPNKSCKTAALHIHGYDNTISHENPLHFYGSDLVELQRLEAQDPAFAEKLLAEYPYTVGQVVFAVRNELARKVEDFLGRRIRLLFLDAKSALKASRKVAEVMAAELGHDVAWVEKEVAEFAEVAKVYQL